MDTIFINRLKDLSNKSSFEGRFTFTSFLSLDEQSSLLSIERELGFFTLFGGIEGSERVVARFGNPDDLGYEQDFPITCLKAQPVLKKFADELSHRDFLGAIMNLGIERKNIGDIFVKDSSAYIFVLSPMADYICEQLTKVKHTVIKCEKALDVPEHALISTCQENHTLASLRLDCIVAQIYDFSRSQCAELFLAKKIFVNGRLNENSSHIVKDGDIISVRGKGRFRFLTQNGVSKKGKLRIEIEKFI